MHMDDLVLSVQGDDIKIYKENMIPFALKRMGVNPIGFTFWIKKRLDNLSRTYMNKLYIARKVGRSTDLIIEDSKGVSITDNFWVYRDSTNLSWNQIKEMRDINEKMLKVVLTGEGVVELMVAKGIDLTSLFTIKGAFPKAILGRKIIKKGNQAEFEVVASEIGKMLGLKTVNARLIGDLVEIDIFTDDNHSLAHASELCGEDYSHLNIYDRALALLFHNNATEEIHKKMYDSYPEFRRDLEKLYLFNYLILNFDLHEENFGILYCTKTFKLLEVAPAYDFNNAFKEYLDPEKNTSEWLLSNIPSFVKRNPEMILCMGTEAFKKKIFALDHLSEKQKEAILVRAKYLTEILYA